MVDTGSKGILVVSWVELSIWTTDGGGGGGGVVNVTSDGWLKGSLLSFLFKLTLPSVTWIVHFVCAGNSLT